MIPLTSDVFQETEDVQRFLQLDLELEIFLMYKTAGMGETGE
jgi:hypothetical protein